MDFKDKQCEYKSKEPDPNRKFHKCSHPDKQPGLYLCVQAST